MLKFKIFPVLLFLSISLFGQKSVPRSTGELVNDFANLMSPQEEAQLTRKLVDYANATSIQITVVTEESLEGADLFEYTVDLAEAWGIGQRQEDNGVLLYVSEQDRKIQIQTGYGSEGFLPDILAKRIIEDEIKPAFRQGRYYQGIDNGTTAIMQLGQGEYTADQNSREKKDAKGGIPAIMVIVFLVILIIVISSLTRGDDDDDDGGYYRGGRYDMDDHRRKRRRRGGGWIFFPFPGGFGGGGSGGGLGGGGGDFGGFGGGGFGGGGAWGEW